jgi:hypothetical protein
MRLAFPLLAFILTFSGVTSAQQPTEKQSEELPTFNGLKLGLTLGSQLKRCKLSKIESGSVSIVEGKVDEFCFRDSYGDAGLLDKTNRFRRVERLHGLITIGDGSYRGLGGIGIYIPDNSNDAAHGIVESVYWDEAMDKSASILSELKEEYGQQPACETTTKRVGIKGIVVDSLRCDWKTTWGNVSFTAPSMKADILSVYASTTRFLEYEAEERRNSRPPCVTGGAADSAK